MCGLYGIIGQGIIKEDIAIFKDLMIFNQVRGIDATGFVAGRSTNRWNGGKQNKKERPIVVKKATDASWFLQNLDDEEQKVINNTHNDFFLGHDRFATTGEANTAAAAHPYDYPNIIGTHNGTVHFKHDKHQSDSDALYASMDEIGVKATIMRMLPNDGYALVWYDVNAGRVNFLRNSKKHFYFVLNELRSVMYYSTEAMMLRCALDRHGVKYDTIYNPIEDYLYIVDPQQLRHGKKLHFCAGSGLMKPLDLITKHTKTAPWEEQSTLEGPGCDC